MKVRGKWMYLGKIHPEGGNPGSPKQMYAFSYM